MAQTLQKSEAQVNFHFFNFCPYFPPISSLARIVSFSGACLIVGEWFFYGSLVLIIS